MQLTQIIEGWKNHLLPKEKEKAYIEYISELRMNICTSCEFHSKNHLSVRPDNHCTNCGCTLSAKTKCLTCNCPLDKWKAAEIINYENT